MATKRDKILYAASTASHLYRFHMPYIEALRKENDVLLMATQGEGIDLPVCFSKRFFSFSNLRTILKIRKILKRERFDRIILHTSLAAFLIRAAMLGMKKRPTVLNVVHGYLFSEKVCGLREKILLFCERLVRKKTDAIAVMNEEDLRIASTYRLSLRPPVLIRGMGIPRKETKASAEALARLPQQQGDLLCTFVGELSKRKNQSFLIDAVAALRREGMAIHLLLLGEGSERAALEEQIQTLSLADAVTLAGNRENVHAYLAATDLYLSASASEGLPFNVMEAMEHGLPILASDVKGQRDLLFQTPHTLYPAGDLPALCNAIAEAAKGSLGEGSCSYPLLEQYRLEAVFERNLKILIGEMDDENENGTHT